MKFIKIILLLLVFTNSLLSKDNIIIDNLHGMWGIGSKIKQQNHTDGSSEINFAPYIFGSFGIVNIEANRVYINITNYDRKYFLSIAGQLRGREATNEKQKSFELGGQIDIPLKNSFGFRTSYLFDIINSHKGSELDMLIFHHSYIFDISILTSIGIQYMSDNLSNYYFGTNDYKIKDAFSAELEVILTYDLNNYSLFIGTRDFFYNDNISNSPIVNQPYLLQLFAGIGYRF